MVVDVDTETGKVVGPVRDDGPDVRDAFMYEPISNRWSDGWIYPNGEDIKDAAWARFKALIDSQGD
jgi:hypothetical protein